MTPLAAKAPAPAPKPTEKPTEKPADKPAAAAAASLRQRSKPAAVSKPTAKIEGKEKLPSTLPQAEQQKHQQEPAATATVDASTPTNSKPRKAPAAFAKTAKPDASASPSKAAAAKSTCTASAAGTAANAANLDPAATLDSASSDPAASKFAAAVAETPIQDLHLLLTDATATTFFDALQKRYRALHKRIDRISRYEFSAVKSLNPDQLESLKELPHLRGASRELDENLRYLVVSENERTALLKSQQEALIAELREKHEHEIKNIKSENNSVLLCLLKMVRELVDLDQSDPVVHAVLHSHILSKPCKDSNPADKNLATDTRDGICASTKTEENFSAGAGPGAGVGSTAEDSNGDSSRERKRARRPRKSFSGKGAVSAQVASGKTSDETIVERTRSFVISVQKKLNEPITNPPVVTESEKQVTYLDVYQRLVESPLCFEELYALKMHEEKLRAKEAEEQAKKELNDFANSNVMLSGLGPGAAAHGVHATSHNVAAMIPPSRRHLIGLSFMSGEDFLEDQRKSEQQQQQLKQQQKEESKFAPSAVSVPAENYTNDDVGAKSVAQKKERNTNDTRSAQNTEHDSAASRSSHDSHKSTETHAAQHLSRAPHSHHQGSSAPRSARRISRASSPHGASGLQNTAVTKSIAREGHEGQSVERTDHQSRPNQTRMPPYVRRGHDGPGRPRGGEAGHGLQSRGYPAASSANNRGGARDQYRGSDTPNGNFRRGGNAGRPYGGKNQPQHYAPRTAAVPPSNPRPISSE